MNPPPAGDISAYLAAPSAPELELARLFGPNAALTIFDIGACEGEDSIRYARRFPRARIYAFEPLPGNQQLVRANFERYGIGNAELVPLALSDQAGEALFHVSSGQPRERFAGDRWNYGNKSSSLLAPSQREPMYGWVEFKEKITVRTETLRNFCTDRAITRIDFIHMDVQGAEHLVLQGAGTLLRQVVAIWLEVSDQPLYTGQKLRSDMEIFMRRHGFALGFEVIREIEGDQFYVNTRYVRTWPYLAGRRLAEGGRWPRTLAGRLWRRLFQ